MATNYPGAVDSFVNPTATDTLDSATVPHAAQHDNINDAMSAVQVTLGVNPQGSSATVVARLTALDSTVAGKAATNQTMYVGTTALAINRSSASQTLTGVSIDGNAGTVTNGVYTSTTSLPNVTSVNSTTIPASATLLTSSSTLDATKLSGTASINTTGSSASATGNAATATALQTARNINGVSFDGTANITVVDATKLPLTGGTLSGQLAVSTSSTSVPQVTVQPTGSFTKSVTSITYVTSTVASINLSDTKGFWVGQVITGSGFAATAYNTSMTITSITANTSMAVTGTGFTAGGAATGTLTASGTPVNVQEWQSSTGTAVASVDGSGNITVLGNLKTSSGSNSVTVAPMTVTLAGAANTVTIGSGAITMSGTAGTGINAGSNAIQTTGNISGATITATTFSGSGASLTSIPTTALTVTGSGTNVVTDTAPTISSPIVGSGTTIYKANSTPSTVTTAITIAQMLNGAVNVNGASITLPTASTMSASWAGGDGTSIEWSAINILGSTSTLTGATGHTIATSNNAAVVTNSSGRFMTRRTSSSTYVTYRLS